MDSKRRYFIGIFIILLGFFLNPFIIERLLPEKEIWALLNILNIFVFEIILLFYGLHLIIRKKIFINAVYFMIFPFLFLSIINGLSFYRTMKNPETSINKIEYQEDILKQKMLERVIFLERTKLAQLSLESGEILYSIHQGTFPLSFVIPEDGVLDTAIGIDPLIKNIFTGTVYFKLYIELNDMESETIFRKDIDLSLLAEQDFVWERICIDLTKHYGKEVTLYLDKGFIKDSQNEPKKFYDLTPLDFMFWRVPSIRPKRIVDKPNVILISLDTLRIDHLHCMGYRRKTSPNLDKLSQDGVFMTKVVSQAPWTTPSHFSIFTSTYPSIHKGTQPIHVKNRYWNDDLPTMAGILRERGYLTSAFTGCGSISASFGLYKGFDFYNETEMGDDKSDVKEIFEKSIEWLKNNKNRTFFLFIHTYEPHAPYADRFFIRKEFINKSNTLDYRTAKYDGDIRKADFYVGKLVKSLHELKLIDETILIVTSDHGEDLGGRNPSTAHINFGHGHNLYDELLLVPLLFHNKNFFPGGERIDYQVRLIDILPTVLDYLKLPQYETFQGESLKAMIEGFDKTSRSAYSEATLYGPERESIRYNGYKYIYRISYGELAHPFSRGMVLSPPHELYDLDKDPGEKMNIYENYKDIAEEYQRLINSIFPERTYEDDKKVFDSKGIDISKDNDLIDRLKSLGYIQY